MEHVKRHEFYSETIISYILLQNCSSLRADGGRDTLNFDYMTKTGIHSLRRERKGKIEFSAFLPYISRGLVPTCHLYSKKLRLRIHVHMLFKIRPRNPVNPLTKMR